VAAAVLALAGLRRMGREYEANYIFTPDEIAPRTRAGALGVEIRATTSGCESCAKTFMTSGLHRA